MAGRGGWFNRGLSRVTLNYMRESLTVCGRTFRVGELELMRHIAREFPGLGMT